MQHSTLLLPILMNAFQRILSENFCNRTSGLSKQYIFVIYEETEITVSKTLLLKSILTSISLVIFECNSVDSIKYYKVALVS
jgi:hypothetical protein